MEERGIQVDHATLNRSIIHYYSQITASAEKRKRPERQVRYILFFEAQFGTLIVAQ
ncbi:hypothetical protein [Methylomonas albis]|nr:hypothetical protein [Methylomonas albis]